MGNEGAAASAKAGTGLESGNQKSSFGFPFLGGDPDIFGEFRRNS